MGIITIGASDREKSARHKQLAAEFQPKARELKDISVRLDQLRNQLQGNIKSSDLNGLLQQAQDLLRQASALCRGNSTMVKEWNITADLTFIYNLVRSLSAAHPTLGKSVIAAEKKELSSLIDKLVTNIGLMCDANGVLSGPEQPAGQPADEGEVPADTLMDHDLDDAPDTLAEMDVEGITQFAEFDNEMPGPLNPELTKVLELPVMATFNRPTSIEELNSRGFEGVNVADYLVLRKAYILGVNLGQCKEKSFDPAKVVKASLEKLSDRLNDEVALVCDTGIRYHKGGWIFYWFGPAKYHRALGGKLDTRLTVTEFKFPFGGAPAEK